MSALSCSNGNPLFKSEVIMSGELKTLTYKPQVEFEIMVDSASNYLTQEDFVKSLSGSFSKGGRLYKSDRFEVRLLLFTYYVENIKQSQFVLRTFSKDFKIIDSFIFIDTASEVGCTGSLNKNLGITKVCKDGTTSKIKIDNYGKFIQE